MLAANLPVSTPTQLVARSTSPAGGPDRSTPPQPIRQAVDAFANQVQAVLKDTASTVDRTDHAIKQTKQASQVVPKDKVSDAKKRPWLKVRLPARSHDIEQITANWRAENQEAPRVAEAIRLYDAVLRADIDKIRQTVPWLGTVLQPGAPKRQKRTDPPVLESPFDPDQESKIESQEGDPALTAMVQAIADITLMDVAINRRPIENLARLLVGRYSATILWDWYERWWRVHWWKGRDNHERPLLADIKTHIGKVRALSPLPEPAPGSQTADLATDQIPQREDHDSAVPSEPPAQGLVIQESATTLAGTAVSPTDSSACLVVPGQVTALALPSDNFEMNLLAYAVEAAASVDLTLNPAARDAVMRFYQAGYRAEDIAYVVEKVWPSDYRGSDTNAYGKSKPRQNLTLPTLAECLAASKHKLTHAGYDSTGQELACRIERIRDRAAHGERINSLDEIRSQTWLDRQMERAETPAEDNRPHRPPLVVSPALRDYWRQWLDSVTLRSPHSNIGIQVRLIEAICDQAGDRLTFEVYDQAAKERYEKTLTPDLSTFFQQMLGRSKPCIRLITVDETFDHGPG